MTVPPPARPVPRIAPRPAAVRARAPEVPVGVVLGSPADRSAAPVARPVAPPLLATSLLLLGVLLLGLVAHVLAVGAVYHARQQQLGFAQLREDLANAVAPVGPFRDGALLEPGTPVALLEVPSLGLREVVREGTTSRVLASGPGHRRDTVLPGQAGTSVLFGRRAAFGGPFGEVERLSAGDTVRVTTGQGVQEYRVLGVRRAGDQLPPPATSGRLTLVTAAGPPFVPSGALRVDADLVGPAQAPPLRKVATGTLPSAEQALAGDRGGLVALLLLSQVLLLAACGCTVVRARWGARQAWVVGVPVLGVLGLAVAHHASALLPNLL